MTPAIVEVTTRRQLRDFIDFPEKLYADSPYWVPDLRGGEFKALGPDNPALEFSERILYLAYYGERIVGRIAGIVNYIANEKWDTRTVRFGWMDFIEDFSVAEALIDAVKNWGASLGMNRMSGPMGFNNLDKAGLLVDGFEYLSPFTCIYNYPYYRDYLERLGFVKEADWTQTVQQITGHFPERILKLTSFLEQRYGFHFYAPKTRKQMRTIGREMFHLYNEAFVNVHGATPLNEKQIDYSLSSYISIMNSKYTCFVMDRENKIAGFAISVPSLSMAIRKAKGRLFPFGFVHILR
ncbi:MAG: hypothetical protein J6Z27_05095, partial [Bacteroidales bacterium]|nr:hypothetical protein [Bacteroidales bacterium]